MFTFGSWQGTAGSQRFELTVANLGTTGYHCKQLPVPRGWNSWFPTWEPEATIASNCRFPEVGTHASQPGKQLPVPTWEPQVIIAKNFQFPKVGTDGSQRGNQRLPWQGTVGTQTLKLTVPNLGTRGCHCKELPGPRS